MAPFDEVIQRFWRTGETYGVGPPLTNPAISDAERKLGVRLAPDYLALLRRQNGGKVAEELTAHPLDPPDPWGTDYVWVPSLDPLEQARRSETHHDPDWGPSEGLVLIASPDAGHQFLALDYRACGPDGEPSVLWSDTEGPFEQGVAPTFRAYVEGLRPPSDFEPDEPPAAATAPKRRRWPFGRR